MRPLIALLLLAAAPAFAQAPQRPSDEEINATIQALRQQREALADQVILWQTQAMKLARELEAEKKKAESCKPADKEKK